jgi:hypothetical protein
MARLDPLAPFDARSPAHPPRGALSCPARIFLALNLSSQPRPFLAQAPQEPRRTNVGAPPTINVKVTRQWVIEV